MPCRDDRDSCRVETVKVENPETKRKLAHVESLLCSACRTLEILVSRGVEFDFDTNPALSEWWADHKAEDDRRMVAEAKRRLEFSRATSVAEKRFKDLTEEDKKLLKKHGFLD